MKPNEINLKCTCTSEIVNFTYDHDPNWKGAEFCISIFSCYNTSSGLPWKARLKLIWQLLRKGEAYGDQVVLNRDHALQLQKFLNENLNA